MHLVFVNGHFPQTTQTFVLNHIDHALQSGDEVTIYSRLLEPGVAHPIIERWHLYDRLIYASPRDRTVYLRVARHALSHPHRFVRGALLYAAGRISRTAFFFLMQLGRAPDVFVANFGPSGIPAAQLKRHFFPKARLAVIFHGYDMSLYINEFGWHRYRLMAPDVDLAFAVHAKWAALLAEQAGLKRVAVHHLGVPVDRISAWRGHDGEDFRMLFAGRMTEKKGFDHLLDALRRLVDEGRNVKLHAVGDGPLAERYRARIAALDLTAHVALHGKLPHDDLLAMLAECDCFVAPSVTASNGDAEGIPVTLMEAMACGIPVVSTWHSGIPELVENEVSGLLAREGDPEALSLALARLIDDPALRRALAVNARERIRRDFDSATQDAVLFESIRALAGDNRR